MVSLFVRVGNIAGNRQRKDIEGAISWQWNPHEINQSRTVSLIRKSGTPKNNFKTEVGLTDFSSDFLALENKSTHTQKKINRRCSLFL